MVSQEENVMLQEHILGWMVSLTRTKKIQAFEEESQAN